MKIFGEANNSDLQIKIYVRLTFAVPLPPTLECNLGKYLVGEGKLRGLASRTGVGSGSKGSQFSYAPCSKCCNQNQGIVEMQNSRQAYNFACKAN